jgi:hypothetical protein
MVAKQGRNLDGLSVTFVLKRETQFFGVAPYKINWNNTKDT